MKIIIDYVKITLDNVPGVRVDLVWLDNDWQEWELPDLIESLIKWTDRNQRNFHADKKP